MQITKLVSIDKLIYFIQTIPGFKEMSRGNARKFLSFFKIQKINYGHVINTQMYNKD